MISLKYLKLYIIALLNLFNWNLTMKTHMTLTSLQLIPSRDSYNNMQPQIKENCQILLKEDPTQMKILKEKGTWNILKK